MLSILPLSFSHFFIYPSRFYQPFFLPSSPGFLVTPLCLFLWISLPYFFSHVFFLRFLPLSFRPSAISSLYLPPLPPPKRGLFSSNFPDSYPPSPFILHFRRMMGHISLFIFPFTTQSLFTTFPSPFLALRQFHLHNAQAFSYAPMVGYHTPFILPDIIQSSSCP